MEYELVEEGEDALFDDSTNPSLKHEDRQGPRDQPSIRPGRDPSGRPKAQKAEVIPEEEEEDQ